jgi:hypothetical protein
MSTHFTITTVSIRNKSRIYSSPVLAHQCFLARLSARWLINSMLFCLCVYVCFIFMYYYYYYCCCCCVWWWLFFLKNNHLPTNNPLVSGRKRMSIAYGVFYGLACITKLYNSYQLLLLGRILAGTFLFLKNLCVFF